MKIRWNKLIEPRMQLKYAGAFACTAGLAIMVQAMVLRISLDALAARLPHDGAVALGNSASIAMEGILISMALLLPLAILVGIGMSFRLAGPLFAIKRQLRSVASGEQTKPLYLREKDELCDLLDLINAALEAERAREPQQDSEGVAEAA